MKFANWYRKAQSDSGYQTQPLNSIQDNKQVNIPTQIKKLKKKIKKAQLEENQQSNPK
jgi:hypothetical protein